MPEQPDKPIEEQLKAWARKRRQEAGAPPELHPATRRMLQEEVARTFARKPSEPAAAPAVGFRVFWPRLALIGSLCMVAVILAGILLPRLGRTKSKAQEIALLSEQEKKAPAQSQTAGTASMENPPQSAPTLAEPPAAGRDVAAARSGFRDEKLKDAEPSDRNEASRKLEASRSVNVADAAKSQGAKPMPGESQIVTRRARSSKEPGQELMRQRYGLTPLQSDRDSVRDSGSTTSRQVPAAPPVQTPAVAAAQGALKSANARPSDGGGLAGGIAAQAATGTAESDRLGGLTTGGRSLKLELSGGESARSGSGAVFAYLAATNPAPAGQRFTQIRPYRVNLNSPPPLNVLQSFQVEQNGRQVHVLDDDGSVYDGLMGQAPLGEATKHAPDSLATTAESKQAAERVQIASAPLPAAPVTLANGFFRVEGTNRTLNQLVVFEGNFLEATNRPGDLLLGAKLDLNQTVAGPRQSGLVQGQTFPRALIQGQVIIGGTNRMEINAAPALRSE
jgi:hypothetical protein